MDNDLGLLREEPWLLPAIIGLALWSFIWKALALYRAGSNRSPVWFIVILLVNTLGVLEILYLLYFGKKNRS
jgi:hypothetical protein